MAVLDLITGPIAPAGQPATAWVAAYDAMLRKGATGIIDGSLGFDINASNFADHNYYDVAFTMVCAGLRLAEPTFGARGREIARRWRDSYGNTVDVWRRKMNAEWGFPGDEALPPPRTASTLGLAVLAAEGDAVAREIVSCHARQYTNWAFGDDNWDPRESAYAMVALVASVALGDGALKVPSFLNLGNSTIREAAKLLLDFQLSRQGRLGPPGSLMSLQSSEFALGAAKNKPWMNNFMGGLVAEGWASYDRVIGDPRIRPALQAYTDWMWNTQWAPNIGAPWSPGDKAFLYGPTSAEFGPPINNATGAYPEPTLNGIQIDAFGYVGRAAEIQQIVEGLNGAFGAHPFNPMKAFPENFRSSVQGVSKLAGVVVTPPVTPPVVVPPVVTPPTPEIIYVEVPGPERIVEVPGPERIVEKIVEVNALKPKLKHKVESLELYVDGKLAHVWYPKPGEKGVVTAKANYTGPSEDVGTIVEGPST